MLHYIVVSYSIFIVCSLYIISDFSIFSYSTVQSGKDDSSLRYIVVYYCVLFYPIAPCIIVWYGTVYFQYALVYCDYSTFHYPILCCNTSVYIRFQSILQYIMVCYCILYQLLVSCRIIYSRYCIFYDLKVSQSILSHMVSDQHSPGLSLRSEGKTSVDTYCMQNPE